MDSASNDPQIRLQAAYTKTLLKFCEDHGYPDGGLAQIRMCLDSLERGNALAALEHYRKVPLGGRMGYFDDWIPPVIFPHENPQYVQAVFDALTTKWNSVMQMSTPNQPNEGSPS